MDWFKESKLKARIKRFFTLQADVQAPLFTYPLIFSTVFVLIKAWHISTSIAPQHASLGALIVVHNDLPLLGFISFFCFATTVFTLRWMRILCDAISTIGAVWYVLDTAVILLLNARVSFSTIILYSGEIYSNSFFASVGFRVFIFLCVIICITFSRNLRIRVNKPRLGLILSFALMFVPSLDRGRGETFDRYGTPIFVHKENRTVFAKSAGWYTQGDFDSLGSMHDQRPTLDLGIAGPNIILVIVESLSAIDSARTSGVGSFTPRFDKMSEEGVLFTNFFANSYNTEGGIVAMMSGTPPIQFPGSSADIYHTYARQDAVIRDLKRRGYQTHFYSSALITFRRRDEYLKSIEFDEYLGADNTPEFRDAPRYVIESVSDSHLYRYTEGRVAAAQESDRPFLFVVETTSSHLPYINPAGRGNDDRAIWDYVDEELFKFYETLKKSGFFDSGILLVTGDHRKMMPITPAERERYGETAEARVPLLAIGHGVPKNRIDSRYFQQSDLFRKLGSAFEEDGPLSSFITFARPYDDALFGQNPALLLIFRNDDKEQMAFPLKIHGNEFRWLAEPPADGVKILQDLHVLTARLQYCCCGTQHRSSLNLFVSEDDEHGNCGGAFD